MGEVPATETSVYLESMDTDLRLFHEYGITLINK